MRGVFYRNSRFVYEGKEGEQTLLNCGDYLSNKSRIPMHRFPGQKNLIIADLLNILIERERKEGNNIEVSLGLILIDVLLVKYLIQTSQPIRVLEYGSGQGKLSCHLAELLGEFHEESILVCAYDTIEPEWMEQISKVERLPKVSFFAGDYGDLQLREDFFDIVIINGTVNYAEPYQVISDVIHLAKENAVIFCYTNNTPLLESVFQLFFERREEYEIIPSSKVMLAEIKDKSWDIHENIDFSEKSLEDIKRAKSICLSKETEKHMYLSMLDTLKQDIKDAIQNGNINLKLQLQEQKECLLRCLFDN